jgi:hypothetical protein
MNMAWRCGGRTNKELVENLFKEGLITSPIVKAAMEEVCLSLLYSIVYPESISRLEILVVMYGQ